MEYLINSHWWQTGSMSSLSELMDPFCRFRFCSVELELIVRIDIRPAVTRKRIAYSCIKVFDSDRLKHLFRLTNSTKLLGCHVSQFSFSWQDGAEFFMSRVSQLTSRWLEQKCLHSGGVCAIIVSKTSSEACYKWVGSVYWLYWTSSLTFD